MRRALLLFVAAMLVTTAQAERDDALLGKDRGYPVGDMSNWFTQPYWVGSWSAMDRVEGMPTRTVARGEFVSPLLAAAKGVSIQWRYRGSDYTLDDFLERNRVTALLIMKNGEVFAERYRYGRSRESRFLGYSMSKGIVSMLVGIAVEQGTIASLQDRADKYAKDLAGSEYGAATIEQLLRMSSGVTFHERYDGNDDVARLIHAAASGQPSVSSVLRSIKDRHAPAGTKFRYASAETEVLGHVLMGATGRSLSDLTSRWLWQPMGAERDGFWLLGHDRRELAWAYFNASLRDWARLGWLVATDGRVGDRQVVPRDYLLDATHANRQPPAFQPRTATPYFGYGYQFWLFPMRERTVAFQGVHGQAIFVQPASGIVMVQLAVNAAASVMQDPQPIEERDAFWRGVLSSLGGSTHD